MPCDWRVFVRLIDSRGWTTSTRCSDELRGEWKCARTSATRKHMQRRTNPTMIYVSLAWLSNEISLSLYVFMCVCGKATALLVLKSSRFNDHVKCICCCGNREWELLCIGYPLIVSGARSVDAHWTHKKEHNIPAFTFELSDFILRW